MSQPKISQLVSGDGAPVVLLQTSILPRWNVAEGAIGNVADELARDFTAVCSAPQPSVISRHGRDLLVMDDCSWPTAVVEQEERIGLVQVYGYDGPVEDLFAEALGSDPQDETSFECVDGRVRLMPCAIFADDPAYPFHEFDLEAGTYRVSKVAHPDAMIVCMEKASQGGWGGATSTSA